MRNSIQVLKSFEKRYRVPGMRASRYSSGLAMAGIEASY